MMRRRDRTRTSATRCALALTAMLAAGAGTASAQAADAPHSAWQAWHGCWTPSDVPAGAADAPASPVTCFLPAAGSTAAEVITVVGERVVERERVELATPRTSSAGGCTGTETLTASPDGRRIYRETAHNCGGGLDRRSTGLMAILPTGEWLDVQGVAVADFRDVRVARQRAVAVPAAVAAEAAGVSDRAMAVDAARLNAAADVGIADIIEASRVLDSEVAEAWLVEREQGFALDPARLYALADAGVPERVIDLMVALSYPQRFAISRTLREGRVRPTETAPRTDPRVYRPVFGIGPSMYPGYGYGFGYGYGYDRYGFQRGYYGYGYSRYPAVIVVRPPGESRTQSGRAVPGRGYTRGGGGGAAAPAPVRAPSPTRGSASGASPSGTGSTSTQGAASSGTSSSGSGDSTPARTAKPRPD